MREENLRNLSPDDKELSFIGKEASLYLFDLEDGVLEIAIVAGNSSNYLNIDVNDAIEIISHLKKQFSINP